MNLVACPRCAELVLEGACSCPHCGERHPCRSQAISRTAALLGLGLALAACSHPSPDYSGAITEDADQDGHESDADLDDDDPSIHPGAPETRGDGIDSNCDGDDDT